MTLHELAVETAEKQEKAESEAFERTMNTFKVNDDVAEQAFREGLAEGKKDKSDKDQRIKQIADHYGVLNQLEMMIEESAELTQAICKLRRVNSGEGYKKAYKNLKEELADVIVVAKQLRYMIGKDDIDRIINEKLDRQMRRISDENTD